MVKLTFTRDAEMSCSECGTCYRGAGRMSLESLRKYRRILGVLHIEFKCHCYEVRTRDSGRGQLEGTIFAPLSAGWFVATYTPAGTWSRSSSVLVTPVNRTEKRLAVCTASSETPRFIDINEKRRGREYGAKGSTLTLTEEELVLALDWLSKEGPK